jgi:carbonic anhydrase/acetyltransferase-like protein (isoleucine patch superfamily)
MITDETTITIEGTFHRIKALKDFGNVKAGQLGGWIKKKRNLSQKGLCWIDENVMVYDNAKIYGNAIVSGDALVCGDVLICGDVIISGNTMVYGYASISGNAKVIGIFSEKKDGKKAEFFATIIGDYAIVNGNALICGEVKVLQYGKVSGNASVLGTDIIRGFSRVKGNTAKIDGLIVSQEDIDKYMAGLTIKL